MSDETELVQDYDLDAPPETVRRAVSIPELREQWLPSEDLVSPEPAEADGRVSYEMREAAPLPDSRVSFEITPNEQGGTRLRVIHRRAEAPPRAVANTNRPCLMLAA
ncbi:hypothetical protein [uncultured Roseobacter sp.]|uniref:SRPBCC family protein n=1 Tax=uncultured Roseobacter sp. TaxID=114847 RepID=UPI00261431EB|nr:hypothetical protein [uncultured Roseobacter sp.]